jgi:integrase
VELVESRLPSYRRWLVENGREERTVKQYLCCLRRCLAHEDGVTARLLDRRLAPKSRRVYLSALRSWATYAEDGQLLKRLGMIKLPPAVRVKPKVELDRETWRVLVRHLQAQEATPMRAVLLIMALRGLRCGDVLRLRRRELVEARRTGMLAFEAKGGRRLEYDAATIREHLEHLEHQRPLGNADWERVADLIAISHDSATRRVRRVLAAYARDLKIDDLHPHRLRRTYATHYLRALDRDPQALIKLQKHLGWASMATAAGYVDATNAEELNQVGSRMVADLLAG